jgi:maleylacetoacetate isomerase
MRLHTWQRNSAGERVRIALNLKGLDYEYVSTPSVTSEAYRQLNPQGLLPALEVEGRVVAQSAAILAYVEETWPEPPLLPPDAFLRAEARAFAQHIAAEMHALTVNRVRRFLGSEFAADQARIQAWLAHWMALGFTALEAALARREFDWPFCFGETPGWADLHLVPQLANARRLGCVVEGYSRLLAVEARCLPLDAFVRARPESQPDYSEPSAPA